MIWVTQEEDLRRSIDEKSMLVREIHHRVKNNLQVIVSLLSLQSSYSNDPHVLNAFQEAESRVRAIARIHEKLYASEDLAEVRGTLTINEGAGADISITFPVGLK